MIDAFSYLAKTQQGCVVNEKLLPRMIQEENAI